MIHSKNNGFTLIEVLLATAIVAIVLTPIFSLQSSTLERIKKMAESVQRMFVAYDFFLDTQKDDSDQDKKQVTKKHEDPLMDLTYEIIDVPKGSKLSKEFNNLYIEKATWQWKETSGKKIETFLNVLFEPPEPKSVSAKASSDKQDDRGNKETKKNKTEKIAEQAPKNQSKKQQTPQRGGRA